MCINVTFYKIKKRVINRLPKPLSKIQGKPHRLEYCIPIAGLVFETVTRWLEFFFFLTVEVVKTITHYFVSTIPTITVYEEDKLLGYGAV